MKSTPVVTRRALAGLLAAPLAAPQATPAQNASMVDSARAEYRSSAEALGKVKLPRSTEPAVRFEA